jgi:putative ABC transport system permease protein
MYFKDILMLSVKNASRGKTRAVLTALMVCIGISSVILISAIGDSGKSIINEELEKLGICGITVFSSQAAPANPLVVSDVELIENSIREVSCAQPVVLEYGGFRLNRVSGNTIFWGVDSEIEKILDIKRVYGRMPNRTDIRGKAYAAVIDDKLALKSYKRVNVVGKNILLSISGKTYRFMIIGVVKSQKDGLNHLTGDALPDFIYIPYTTLNGIRNANDITQIAIKCENSETLAETGEKAVRLLSRTKNNPDGFSSENLTGYVENLKSIANLVTLLISAIAAISLGVAGLGIINTMISNTVERRKEIGICMAVGAKRRDISICFLTEAVIISCAGGTVGAIAGAGLFFIITRLLGTAFMISPVKILVADAVSVICGAVFSVIPARHASRLGPIESLKND